MSEHAYQQAQAQAESIEEMVAALQCDYERLEELREQKAESRFSFNFSLVGCMPDGEPSFFEDEEDARAALVEELRERAEQDEESAASIDVAFSDSPSMALETRKELRERARDYVEAADNVEDEELSSVVVNGWHFWIVEDAEGALSDEEKEELSELEEAAGDCEDEEDARRRIEEDALSVEVRSAWHLPGDEEGAKAADFRIVLCTGGPHVEIRGELDEHGDPTRAWLESCGWLESKANHGAIVSQDTLLAYASCFYFGE